MTKNTTMSATRMSLKVSAEKSVKAYKDISSNGEALNKQVQSAKEAMNTAIDALNRDMLVEIYTRCLSSDNPISAFARTNKYTMYTSRLTKDGVLCNRTERLNLNSFFQYAKDQATPIVDEHALQTKLEDLTDKIMRYVAARIQKEDDTCGLELNKAKCALDKVLKAINVEGVKARNIDVKYLSTVMPKAKKMGLIDKIDTNTTSRYLMDVFHVQITGVEYDFDNVTL